MSATSPSATHANRPSLRQRRPPPRQRTDRHQPPRHHRRRPTRQRQSMQEFLPCELERFASRPSIATWLEGIRARARQWRKLGSNRTISCTPVTTVVDASALVAGPVDSGDEGRWGEATFDAGELAGQELVLVEAGNILRRLEQGEKMSRIEATSAHRILLRLDIQLLPFAPFAERIWVLRANLTSYDAWYVALAEALDGPLAPLDRKLSRTGGPNCENIVPPSPVR